MRTQFKMASMLLRIIYVNIGVFVALRLLGVVGFLCGFDYNEIISHVELPSNPSWFVSQPWTLITYMFVHHDILHILFNMLWLWWFGKLFLEFFSPRHLTGLYFVGGIGGGLLYVVAYNLLPVFAGHNGMLLGASASVIAIVVATAVKAPNYRVGLLFFGSVSIKWVAIVTIFIDLIGITADNAGGHISHIGGAIVGAIFTLMLHKGFDVTAWFNSIIDLIVNSYRRLTARRGRQRARFDTSSFTGRSQQAASSARSTQHSESTRNSGGKFSAEDEKEMDEILKKIKVSGYSSLTDDEKSRLFKTSRKLN